MFDFMFPANCSDEHQFVVTVLPVYLGTPVISA